MSNQIRDIVSSHSMHPTSDAWYPSYDRGYEDEPKEFPECECSECLVIPSENRQQHARWEWKAGGKIACFFTVFDELLTHPDNYEYIAKISFWGNDDFGMEKYFRYEDDARRFVCHLPPYISIEFLMDHGFVSA